MIRGIFALRCNADAQLTHGRDKRGKPDRGKAVRKDRLRCAVAGCAQRAKSTVAKIDTEEVVLVLDPPRGVDVIPLCKAHFEQLESWGLKLTDARPAGETRRSMGKH